MTHLILLVVFTLLGFVLQGMRQLGRSPIAIPIPPWAPWTAWAIALLIVASTSFVVVDQDKIGHLKRIFLAADMSTGSIIAQEGEKGPQARILGPGFHMIPIVNVLYQFEEFDVVEIPQGSYGFLTAKDGEPLRAGQFIASGSSELEFNNMLDAEYFLANRGTEGSAAECSETGYLPHQPLPV